MNKVVPEMMVSDKLKVHATASRAKDKAKQAAGQLGIPKAYDSYEDMLDSQTNLPRACDLAILKTGCGIYRDEK